MDWFSTRYLNREKLPLVIEPVKPIKSNSEFFDLVKSDRPIFLSLLKKEGALLFRGFPLESASDFSSFIEQLGTGKFFDYTGGDSPRNRVAKGVYTSTEAPPNFKILLHNELSYVKNYPSHIFFFCEIPPKEKGETMIADARKVFQNINEKVRQKFIDKRIGYTSNYFYQNKWFQWLTKRSHKSWIQVFDTESKSEVERIAQENEFDLKWGPHDWLQMNQIRPAINTHPETGETVWFNQAHIYDFNPKSLGFWNYLGTRLFYCRKFTKLHEVAFGDGSPIPRKDLYHVMDVLEDHTIYFPWEKGDLLALDNILTMHGRAPFEGKRRILTAMTG